MAKAVTGPKGQQRRSHEQESALKHRDDVVAFVMSTPDGREFMWSLLSDCGLFKSSWHPSAAIYFNEGRRDVGLRIMSELTSNHSDAYLLMQKEAMDRAQYNKAHESIYMNEDNDDE